jgi:hypothetical protein
LRSRPLHARRITTLRFFPLCRVTGATPVWLRKL